LHRHSLAPAPEATLYLPLGVSFNRNADTLLYLIDDPKQTARPIGNLSSSACRSGISSR